MSLWSQISYCKLLQHPQMHSCGCCYALGCPVPGFRGGNHLESLVKKQDRPRQTDGLTDSYGRPKRLKFFTLFCSIYCSLNRRRLLSCLPQMPMICFFVGNKSEMI